MKIVEYVLMIKIKCAIYQALLESKNEDPDFSSLDELAVAIALDSVRFLEDAGLIEIKDLK